MSLNLKPYTYRKDANGGTRLASVNPYIRLSDMEHGAIFVQSGQFFYENGPAVKEEDVPDWVWQYIDKWTPEARRKVGLDASQAVGKKK